MMTSMNNKLWLGSLLIAGASMWAQNANQAPVQNPPSRVARLDLIQGKVSFQLRHCTRLDSSDTELSRHNRGDHLYADADSRAQLRMSVWTAVRLGPASSMSFLNLNDRLVQIRLDQGALILRVKFLDADDAYEINTAQCAITILSPGEYRVDTDPDQNTTKVTTRDGEAAVTSSAGGSPVHPHQTAILAADGPAQFQTENPNDTFDVFAKEQDRDEDSMGAPRFVSRELPGWQDLDRNGSWTQDPTYGPVWRPLSVQTGWAPYRDGHWAWVEPWGWTWIDGAPWGFAPFHYGRWAMVGTTWEWVPGLMPPRPLYAPALVQFAALSGLGAAEGVTPGVGTIAWFPLGPREIFVPAYTVTSLYVDRINSTTVNINNVAVVNHDYMNQKAGMTVVDQRAFAGAQPVRRAMIKVSPEAMGHAAMLRAASVSPQRTSVLAHADPPADVPRPRAAVLQRTVQQSAPPPAAVPLAAKQQVQQANPAPTSAPVAVPAVKTLPPSPVTARPTPPAPAAPAARPPVAAPASADLAPGERPKIPRPEKPPVEHVREKPKPAVPDHPLTKEEKAEAAKQRREADRKKQEENDR